MSTNIGQIRAKAAWDFAQGTNDAYGSYVKKLPMYIKTNGLINALAFARSKGSEWDDLYKNLQNHFRAQNPTLFTQNKELIQVLIDDADENDLRMATVETFALLTWLKRFVK
jgi:CRISPR type III-B/RAMP module-associated protein Cmr5